MRRLLGQWSVGRVITVLVIMAGVVVLLYPTAAQWFSAQAQATVIGANAKIVQAMDSATVKAILAKAHAYNDALPSGPLEDPYRLGPDGKQVEVKPGKPEYEAALNVGPDGVMGQLVIPSVRIDLPIYHDATEASLAKGIGHLYGSSLPVGGPDTRSVLTAHSGIAQSSLFTSLDQVKRGDLFEIETLDQILAYQVYDIRIVLPDQVSSLRREPGQDLVTLVTCTPIGVNTHRLLVTGRRVPTPPAVARSLRTGAVSGAGFPWWVLIGLGALFLVVLVTTGLGGRPVPGRKHSGQVGKYQALPV